MPGLFNDPAKLAGLITVAALGVLIALHRGFAGIRVKVGD